MISLDWKERLKIDTEDFVKRKLPMNNYDIDIVYNAYPKRVDNNVPADVISFVAKTLSGYIGKEIDQYTPFLEYLWDNKGENGHQIFIRIMKSAVKKKPEVFVDYLRKILTTSHDKSEIKALVKTLIPLLKKEPKKYIDTLYSWLAIRNTELQKAIINTFLIVVKDDNTLMKYVFQKMEREWLYPTPYTIRNSIMYLKAVYKISPEFYFSVYENYKCSRNPVFVEILCGSLNPIQGEEYYQKICEYLNNWSQSGNIRIKKAANAGLKLMKKKPPAKTKKASKEE